MVMSAVSWPPRTFFVVIGMFGSWVEREGHQAEQGDETETCYSLSAP
jgi:hypothetical protein